MLLIPLGLVARNQTDQGKGLLIRERKRFPQGRRNHAFGIDVLLLQGEEDDPPEALDMGWPSSARKRLTYILVAPILFPLWLTLPDTRTPRGKWYPRNRESLGLYNVEGSFARGSFKSPTGDRDFVSITPRKEQSIVRNRGRPK